MKYLNMFPIHFPAPEGQNYRDAYDQIDWSNTKVRHVDNSPPIRLLLVGYARSGKNAVADVLQRHIRTEARCSAVDALATPIKYICRELFDWDIDHVYGHLKDAVDPAWGFSPRRAMQLLGTEFGRALDPDLWVKMSWREWDEMADPVIYADGRFLNEARFFKANGGYVWRIVRPGCSAGSHASEMDQDSAEMVQLADETIFNDGTLEDLRVKATAAWDRLVKSHQQASAK